MEEIERKKLLTKIYAIKEAGNIALFIGVVALSIGFHSYWWLLLALLSSSTSDLEKEIKK